MEDCLGRCVCGAEVVVLTSWMEDNPGRRFFRCGKMKNGSMNGKRHYFAWLDKPMPFRAKVVINGLLRKIDALEKNKMVSEGDLRIGCAMDSKSSQVGEKESTKWVSYHLFLIVALIVLGIVIGNKM
ncbi:hypothetical protein LINPERPRIM_LOCUS30932 [Linum perenne]